MTSSRRRRRACSTWRMSRRHRARYCPLCRILHPGLAGQSCCQAHCPLINCITTARREGSILVSLITLRTAVLSQCKAKQQALLACAGTRSSCAQAAWRLPADHDRHEQQRRQAQPTGVHSSLRRCIEMIATCQSCLIAGLVKCVQYTAA